jgi:hypothetical protein
MGWRSNHEPRRSNRPQNRADGLTASPGGQTAHGIRAGDLTTRPYAAPPSPALPTSTVSRALPTTPAASPVALASQLYPLHYSRRPHATREPPAPPLHQQSPPAKVVPMAPPVNPHLMTTRPKRGFWLTDSPCQPLQRRPCHRCPPPSTLPSPIQIGTAPWKKNLPP